MKPENVLREWLRAGVVINAVGNYVVGSPTAFEIAPSAGEIYHIHRLIISYSATGEYDQSVYGDAGALGNGFPIEVYRNGTLVTDLTDSIVVQSGADLATIADRLDIVGSVNHHTVNAVLDFWKNGTEITLKGDDSESLRISLNDDFSAMSAEAHRFRVTGIQ